MDKKKIDKIFENMMYDINHIKRNTYVNLTKQKKVL